MEVIVPIQGSWFHQFASVFSLIPDSFPLNQMGRTTERLCQHNA